MQSYHRAMHTGERPGDTNTHLGILSITKMASQSSEAKRSSPLRKRHSAKRIWEPKSYPSGERKPVLRKGHIRVKRVSTTAIARLSQKTFCEEGTASKLGPQGKSIKLTFHCNYNLASDSLQIHMDACKWLGCTGGQQRDVQSMLRWRYWNDGR